MSDAPQLNIGDRHLLKTSGGFDWNGERRWWEWFGRVVGYNGVGGYWIEEEYGWNGGSVMGSTSRSLSWEESRSWDRRIAAGAVSAPALDSTTGIVASAVRAVAGGS